VFVVLDGVDGCGKTTQAARLVRTLASETGGEVLHLREPGSTRLGEAIRGLVLDPEADLSPAVETLLFVAARRQMLDEVVAPALARGASVVVERFHASTFAYQVAAGGLAEEDVLDLLERFAGSPRPDLVLILDVPAEVAASRASARRTSDRIEAKGLDFQRRVAEGFKRYASLAERVVLVDARGAEEAVAAAVLEEVRRAT
jgi:dTMP kinase